jgi:hypothetical protein
MAARIAASIQNPLEERTRTGAFINSEERVFFLDRLPTTFSPSGWLRKHGFETENYLAQMAETPNISFIN